MLRVIKQSAFGLRQPVYAALTLCFSSFGDAFLYAFLPQYADIMQIPAIWIGVLLSVNRFIRIIITPFILHLFARYGVRSMTLLAAIMAIVSTGSYGMGWGLISLILFRLIWGVSFAILRLSTMAYAFEYERIGFSLGISKSIQEAGPVLALLVGPLLLDVHTITHTFFLLAILSLPSIVFASGLPELNYSPTIKNSGIFRLPSLFNSITFALSFIGEGVLVIVVGSLIARSTESPILAITSLTAGYLAYRRICSIFLAPLGGLLADRIGFNKVFIFSLLMVIAGLLLLINGSISAGLIVVFAFNSINSAMAPGGASLFQHDRIRAISINATWRDIGAATGTMAGGLLLTSGLLFETFIITTFIIIVLLSLYLRPSTRNKCN